MVEIPDSLRSLFTATIEEQGDSYVIEVPKSEIENEGARPGQTYRVAVLPQHDGETTTATPDSGLSQRDRQPGPPAPPVEEGEVRQVVIESIGDQGDGIAKVERGYVVIVPDTEPGEEPTVEIEEVKENVAFATVVE